MRRPADTAMYPACLVRFVEEELLRLFSAGKLSGTTHTCIGQEMSGVALAASLDRERDIIFSNHRCHGHYLAWTGDVEGLIAEVMGKRSGVCGGIGGSQHLCSQGFFSNGIQGGIVPVSAGLALAAKRAGHGGIVAACIGDGTLGEGVLYETLNIASKWRLPLLFVLENNLYAQSTSQAETLAGDICARAAAFAIPTFHGDTWAHDSLNHTMERAVALVRNECAPAFVRVDTYRLAAHSKGDDDRDPAEIRRYAQRDPVNLFLAGTDSAQQIRLDQLRSRVRQAIELADADASLPLARPDRTSSVIEPLIEDECGTQLEAINRTLRDWMAADPNVIVLGEDLRSPYGGAFKVTRGLSDDFPDRVLNTPISEAAIVGIGNGLALAGLRPVVEIMFGDFLTLCFDQLLNHAAKFVGMYNHKIANPLVVRTPMGGGRGYGPTHSQNLEKHFVGIPGITTLVLHGRTCIRQMYRFVRQIESPLLIIENKLLYRERTDAPLPPGYQCRMSAERFPTTVLTPDGPADLTLVALGRMSVLAEKVAAQLREQEEIRIELLFPLQISPFEAQPVLESVARTGKLLVVEEGAAGFDLGAEIIATACIGHRGATPLRCQRLTGLAAPIPSAPSLEQQHLPGVASITAACLELFDD